MSNIKLTKEEKDKIIANEIEKREQQAINQEKMNHFQAEFNDLCKKYGVSPQINANYLLNLCQELPKAVNAMQITFGLAEQKT